MTVTWIIMIIAGYILGSVPASWLAAKARGIDLRKHGTHQVGGGNLFRTASRRLGVIISVFDFFKGALMVLIAHRIGLDATQQLIIGVAVVAGHNWPVFLRFHGGRGIATSGGIIVVMPLINPDVTFWGVVAYAVILFTVMMIFHSSPVAILVGLALQPVFTAIFQEPLSLTLAYIALLLVIIIKRLTAQATPENLQISIWRLLLNRLLYDRDYGDRKAWMDRKPKTTRESA